MPNWGVDLSFLEEMGFASLNPTTGIFEIAFLDRMGFVFLICVFLMVVLADKKEHPKALQVDTSMFKPTPGFTMGSLAVCVILTALYTIFW